MSGALGQAAFFVVLILAILVHEGAHYGVAKAFGFKVEEFFVGFGPKLWSTRRGDTEYGVKLIPAGGYVKIAGMNPFQRVAPEDLPRTYAAKPAHQRALMVLAGPVTHFALALAFFGLWLGLVGEPRLARVVASVPRTIDGRPSPAYEAGLRPGDVIVGIGPIDRPTDAQFQAYTRAHVGRPVEVRVEREGRVLAFTLRPVWDEIDGERVARIGVLLDLVEVGRERAGPIEAIGRGARLVGESVAVTVRSLGDIFGPRGIGRVFELLFTDAPRATTDPVSPIGVGRAVGETASAGLFGDALYVFGAVNVFIGVLNLIPLPPFDGGHLAVLAVEKVRGRRIDPRKLVPLTAAVATFLILFGLSVVYLDLVKPVRLLP
ncbi:MAG TPA: M50 family metallopeptidase [Actinomycetota bacterium]|nr:M50 family metallopeptidase [Actinomycetota bacterium]